MKVTLQGLTIRLEDVEYTASDDGNVFNLVVSGTIDLDIVTTPLLERGDCLYDIVTLVAQEHRDAPPVEPT